MKLTTVVVAAIIGRTRAMRHISRTWTARMSSVDQ
eukprot:SAG11_NODE_27755_length_329_cov_1.073913_1_plen_34_part_10